MRPLSHATLLVALAFTAYGVSAWAQQDPAHVAAAQQRFERGLALYDRREFVAALPEFRAALELYATPNIRLYVGLCLKSTGRLAAAYAELQRTHTEARDRAATNPDYADARDVSAQALDELRPQLAHLVVRVTPANAPVRVRIGETEVLPAMFGLPIPFDPGEVRVTAEGIEYRAEPVTVRLVANATAETTLTLQATATAPADVGVRVPTITPTRPENARTSTPMTAIPQTLVSQVTGGGVRTAGVVVAGIGVAGVVAFAVLGTLSNTLYDDLVTRCPRRCVTSTDLADVDTGEGYDLAANISLGVGLAAVLAGSIMIAVGGPRAVDDGGDTRRARVAPWLDPERSMAGVSGAF
jgi:serine/threonine-protein kinase